MSRNTRRVESAGERFSWTLSQPEPYGQHVSPGSSFSQAPAVPTGAPTGGARSHRDGRRHWNGSQPCGAHSDAPPFRQSSGLFILSGLMLFLPPLETLNTPVS